MGEMAELNQEVQAWTNYTNGHQRTVDWQFQVDEARIKLKRLYPSIYRS